MEFRLQDSKIFHLSKLLFDNTGGIERILDKLSWIQIDAIYVTARSQDLVLHSRLNKYTEEEIWKTVSSGKAFEGFAHARGIIPMQHFPYYYTGMLRRRGKVNSWVEEIAKDTEWQKQVLEQVENEGAVNTKDIVVPKTHPEYSGWSNASKRMLDYLYLRGYLSVAKRDKFQLYYDLPERVIPNFDKLTSNLPSREEEFEFHLRTTLTAVGPASLHRLLNYKYISSRMKINGKRILPRTLVNRFEKEGILEKIKVSDSELEYYWLPEKMDELTNIPAIEDIPKKVYLLSPFDNVLWSREALEEQYGFYYRLECYVPAKKRIYGFFVMPILYGIDFVGRVDPALDRKQGVLNLKQWTWEKGFKPNRHFFGELAETITKFVGFHGVDTLSLGDLKSTFKTRLTKEFDKNQIKIIE